MFATPLRRSFMTLMTGWIVLSTLSAFQPSESLRKLCSQSSLSDSQTHARRPSRSTTPQVKRSSL